MGCINLISVNEWTLILFVKRFGLFCTSMATGKLKCLITPNDSHTVFMNSSIISAPLRTVLLPLCLMTMLCGMARADDVYVCTDDYGNKTYQNMAGGKNCKRVDLPNVTTIPAPKVKAGASSGSSSASSPSGFPKVDPTTQKSRDTERRRILEQELAGEEQKLANLRQEYNNGEPERRGDERNYQRYLDRVSQLREDISRTENNVSSLKRELGNLKD